MYLVVCIVVHKLVFLEVFLPPSSSITGLLPQCHTPVSNWLRPFLSARNWFLLSVLDLFCCNIWSIFKFPVFKHHSQFYIFVFRYFVSMLASASSYMPALFNLRSSLSPFSLLSSVPSQMCGKVLCSDALQLRLSGDFHPLGGFNSSGSHLHSSDVPISFTACFSCPWCLDWCRILFTAAVLISPV